MNKQWEIVIGLEIHAQLNTKSKIFSPATNHFGDEPNTNISSVCTGQPGVLPLLNKDAVRKAVQFGLAVQGAISEVSTFDRKSYFYPDCPKNFQITQFFHPIVLGGKIVCEVEGKEKEFFLERVHMEEDAGSFKHFSKFGGIDYNRSGAPLIEIVSEPCMHSPEEAASYAKAIRAILLYLDASDCNMEEGSIRFDANISVRKIGETALRPRTEVKNLNSFNFLQIAIKKEAERQIALYEKNPDTDPKDLIEQGTYRFDAEKKEITLMRTKEGASDYRYCPEPDLPPLLLNKVYIDKIKEDLPELPRQRAHRYVEVFQLNKETALQLTEDKKLSDYFEKAMEICKNPKSLANWIMVEFMGKLKEKKQTFSSVGLKAENIAYLVNLIEEKVITGRMGKQIAELMMKDPKKDPRKIVEENPDFQPLSDESAIELIVEKVVKAFPDSIVDYKKGRTKALSFLVGQVMKETRGKANPETVNKILIKKLDLS